MPHHSARHLLLFPLSRWQWQSTIPPLPAKDTPGNSVLGSWSCPCHAPASTIHVGCTSLPQCWHRHVLPAVCKLPPCDPLDQHSSAPFPALCSSWQAPDPAASCKVNAAHGRRIFKPPAATLRAGAVPNRHLHLASRSPRQAPGQQPACAVHGRGLSCHQLCPLGLYPIWDCIQGAVAAAWSRCQDPLRHQLALGESIHGAVAHCEVHILWGPVGCGCDILHAWDAHEDSR